jgi:hypothetical protein
MDLPTQLSILPGIGLLPSEDVRMVAVPLDSLRKGTDIDKSIK